jgi:hypothetical protein
MTACLTMLPLFLGSLGIARLGWMLGRVSVLRWEMHAMRCRTWQIMFLVVMKQAGFSN